MKKSDRVVLESQFKRVLDWNPDDPQSGWDPYDAEDGEASPTVRALMDASIVGDFLNDLYPKLIKAAREEGETWTMIGESMGISRQAAQQRYGR